jgi:hypothetical protein
MVTVIVVKVAIQNDDPWEVLQYAVAFALRGARKTVRGLKEVLTEDERYAVADHVVAQLKDHGDPWNL